MATAAHSYITSTPFCRHHAAASVAADGAALICFALEFHILRGIERSPVSAPDGIDVEAFFAARRKRRAIADQILALRPQTADGRRSQAAVVAAMLADDEFHPVEPRRETAR